jgi:hypothetical protein
VSTKTVQCGIVSPRDVGRSARGEYRLADSCELSKMQQIMARIEPNHVRDAFVSAFCVNADALEVVRRRTSDQVQIRSPKHTELFERHFDWCLIVMEAFCPPILIVAGERRAVLCKNQAHAVSPHQVGIREVSDHVPNRPLAGRLRLGEFTLREIDDSVSHGVWGATEHVHRIIRSEKLQYGSRVLTGLFDRTRGGIRKDRHFDSLLQIIYSVERDNVPLFIGQQLDVFFDASRSGRGAQ